MYFVLLQQQLPPIPASGYLLCFIPLALVIIGFIVAARFTDQHATRPYRRLQPENDPAASSMNEPYNRLQAD
jgi:cytochrome c-type biogenesis protein CcmH/NrfF